MTDLLSSGDVNGILATLRGRDVDCILIGGAAAWAHGASQRPHDVDVVLRADWRSYENAAAALIDLHGRFPDYSDVIGPDAALLLPPVRIDAAAIAATDVSTWQTDHGGLDFFDSIQTPTGARYYEDLATTAETRTVAGVRIPVASLDDVIASKTYAGRPKDLVVVDELHRIRRNREGRTALPPPKLANRLDPPGPRQHHDRGVDLGYER